MAVLILHGINGHAGIHWQQWLQKDLVKRGYEVIMPDLPDSDKPDRKKWLKTVRKLVKNLNHKDLVIVGHSLGVVSALDYLEKTKTPIRALLSISGFFENYGSDLNKYFLKEKDINFKKVKEKVLESFVIYGDNDPFVPQDTLENLAKNLDVEPFVIARAGHLNAEAGYTEFPMLVRIIENLNR
ncbi:alpha/beta fold hydrolase [Patescibacteria group bacterium]|nr:alpha/beta fold hydrolase [Patescibacteria group bacterium]